MGVHLFVLLISFINGQVLESSAPFTQLIMSMPASSSITQPEACLQELQRNRQDGGSRGKYAVGLCLLKQGKLLEAEEALKGAIQLDQSFAPAHEALGELFLQQHKTADATREFTSVLQFNPDSIKARFNLGTALSQENRYNEAMWEMLEVFGSDPKYVPAIGTLSFILDRLGDNAAAIAYLEAATRLIPRSAELHIFLGSHQYEASQYPEACGSYRKALRLNPQSDRAHDGWGLALLRNMRTWRRLSSERRCVSTSETLMLT